MTDTTSAPSGLSRRDVVSRGAAASLGLVLAGSIERLFSGGEALAATNAGVGYGPLVPDPKGVLALPEGFSDEIVAEAGRTKLRSGQPPPSDQDGSASFPSPDGKRVLLINNHEISGSEEFKVPHVEGLVYDEGAG